MEDNLTSILSKSKQQKGLIRLPGCTGWSAPLLFASDKVRFSHVEAHIMSPLGKQSISHAAAGPQIRVHN